MSALAPADAAKLAAILSRLQSPYEGEQVAAALAASRFVAARGLRWEYILGAGSPPAPPAPAPVGWRQTVAECILQPGSLRPWEKSFLQNLRGFAKLSPKQTTCLLGIADRVLARRAA